MSVLISDIEHVQDLYCLVKEPLAQCAVSLIKCLFITIEVKSWIRWSKTFTCYSEFHDSYEAIITQLPEKMVTIHNRCVPWRDSRDAMAN